MAVCTDPQINAVHGYMSLTWFLQDILAEPHWHCLPHKIPAALQGHFFLHWQVDLHLQDIDSIVCNYMYVVTCVTKFYYILLYRSLTTGHENCSILKLPVPFCQKSAAVCNILLRYRRLALQLLKSAQMKRAQIALFDNASITFLIMYINNDVSAFQTYVAACIVPLRGLHSSCLELYPT